MERRVHQTRLRPHHTNPSHSTRTLSLVNYCPPTQQQQNREDYHTTRKENDARPRTINQARPKKEGGSLPLAPLTSDSLAIISGTLHTISPSTESWRLSPPTCNHIRRAPSSPTSPAAAPTPPPFARGVGVRAPIGPELSKPCRSCAPVNRRSKARNEYKRVVVCSLLADVCTPSQVRLQKMPAPQGKLEGFRDSLSA